MTTISKGTAPLSTSTWQQVNARLLAKSLAELMHEEVLPPAVSGNSNGVTHFRLQTDHSHIFYTFDAASRMLDYWHVFPESIRKEVNGEAASAVDAPAFFTEMQQTLGIKPFTLARYLEEILHTLYADAAISHNGRPSAAMLADGDYQQIEHSMDGHPWVIVNKSRIGFGAADYYRYAPEVNRNVQLTWLAVHRSRASFRSLEGLDEQTFLREELGNEKYDAFRKVLTGKGLDPADYTFVPIHEWQWNNKLVVHFAGDIAADYIVVVGESEDEYSPQQSIRTFYNISHPQKHYVKVAISILSTGNIRGLSPKQMSIAPRITTWVKEMLENDPVLTDMGLILLGEVATVTYLHPNYSAINNPPYQFNEMLGALWRESAAKYLRTGETVMTMASLLYVDDNSNSFAGELIKCSGLSTAAWVRAYLDAYLTPLLQIYYQHSLCVTPHGENIILVMKNHVPTRIIIKDFVDDIVLTAEARDKLPEDLASGLIQSSNKENVPLFLLLGVFDAFFRYFADVLHTFDQYNERLFWKQVLDVITAYQAAHPELAARFEKYNLFTASFKRFYINSLRLLHHGYEERTDFAIPPKGGLLANPLVQVSEMELNAAG